MGTEVRNELKQAHRRYINNLRDIDENSYGYQKRKNQALLAIHETTWPTDDYYSKLEYYGIRGSTLACIQAWLVERTQHVVLEGEHSNNSYR